MFRNESILLGSEAIGKHEERQEERPRTEEDGIVCSSCVGMSNRKFRRPRPGAEADSAFLEFPGEKKRREIV